MCNKFKKRVALSSVLAIGFLLPGMVLAQDSVIAPVGVTASTSYPGWGEPEALIDGSGLTMTGTIWEATGAGSGHR